MPYTQGVDFISDTTEVRRLSRNVVTGDFANDKITPYQYKVYSQIRTDTNKDDWDSGDREFGALQLVETEWAASFVLEHYGAPEDIPLWQAMRESAKEAFYGNPSKGIKGILNTMDADIPETESEIDNTDRKGWGLNPNLEPPNRLENTNFMDNESF